MPKVYAYKSWVFTKLRDGSGGAYYRVVDNNGRYAAYEHFFQSISEMEDFADSDGGLR